MSPTEGYTRFEEAVFGDVGGRTDELARSGPYPEVLSLSADLPETLPAGFVPPPHLSIRVAEGSIGFLKTAIDPGASRGGMVRTHLLTAPLSQLEAVSDIGPVLDALDPFVPLETVRGRSFLISQGSNVSPVPGTLPLLLALLHRVCQPSDPIVWVGIDPFEEVLRAVWARAPRSLRRALSVRLGLKPQNQFSTDRQTGRAQLIVVPEGMSSFWMGGPTIGISTPDPTGPLVDYLEGKGGPVGDLLGDLGVDVGDVSSYDDLEQAAALRERLGSPSLPLSTSEGLLLAELVAELAPGLAPEATLRRSITDALIGAATREGGQYVQQLRTFDARSFADGEEVLRAQAEAWAARALHTDDPIDHDIKTAELAFTSHNGLWNGAVQGAIRSALRTPSKAVALNVLGWWGSHDALIKMLTPFIPHSRRHEDAFSAALSNTKLATRLRPWASDREWAVFHAWIVLLAEAPVDALRSQVRFVGGRRSDALHLVAERASPDEIVGVAVETEDDVLIDLAVKAVLEEPSLLGSVNVWERAGQQVWAKAVSGGVELPEALSVLDIVTEVARGRAFPLDLLTELLSGPKGDLLDIPNRATVWGALPPSARVHALRQTASGWARAFRAWAGGAGGSLPGRPEPPLASAIAAEISPSELLPLTAGSRALVELFESVPAYEEEDFIEELRRVAHADRAPTHTDAASLGRFAYQRGWKASARELRELAGRYREYRPAHVEASALLGPLENLVAVFFGSSQRPRRLDPKEWWRAFEDLATQLYPEGVRERDIVERSGGDISSMKLYGKTGRDQWHSLIQGLQRDMFDFDARDLLKAMKSQHPSSPHVSRMLNLYNDHLRR